MALFFSRYRRKIINNVFFRFVFGLLFIYFYCEYLIYYVTQVQCVWPSLKNELDSDTTPVYAMVLADTHLLGNRKGHWFDKWRREWQMKQAFQAAMFLHRPEVVFVLGDLFDEGNWASEREFNDYVERFHRLFHVPEGTTMYSVVGNHDIGFHYRYTEYGNLFTPASNMQSIESQGSPHYLQILLRKLYKKIHNITPHLTRRFEDKLQAPPVRLVSIRGNHFVLVNSMAMEGDGCSLCSRAVSEIDRISDILKCSSGSALCRGKTRLDMYSRPIIMQHYPLYRESDSICTEPDAAPLPERNNLFVQRWDCLSKESTEYLVESLLPRTAFGGHTHHSCVVRHSFVPTPEHKIEFIEYSVPSFSWRNRLDPKYYLVTITPQEVSVSKCGMPREWTMKVTAILMLLALLVYLRYFNLSDRFFNYKHLSGKKV